MYRCHGRWRQYYDWYVLCYCSLAVMWEGACGVGLAKGFISAEVFGEGSVF